MQFADITPPKGRKASRRLPDHARHLWRSIVSTSNGDVNIQTFVRLSLSEGVTPRLCSACALGIMAPVGDGGDKRSGAMNPKAKRILQLCADNVFWVFLALMIILGSAIDTPMINVGLTAR